MKHFTLPTLLACALQVGTAQAATVTADGISFITSTLRINTGDSLPNGLEVISEGPEFDLEAASSLDAPDAVPFQDSDVVIAGVEPSNPSLFSGTDSNLRNGNTEGGIGIYAFRPYQTLVPEVPFDGSNDVGARGVTGESFAQARQTTDPYAMSGSSFVSSLRVLNFENTNNTALTFGINGFFEGSLAAVVSGAESTAFASFGTAFDLSSDDPLDIDFAFTAPVAPDEFTSGPNTFAEMLFVNNPLRPNFFGLQSTVRASSDDPFADAIATAGGTFDFVLGVTLQPGQQMRLGHIVNYQSLAEIAVPPSPVPLPAGLPLLGFALLGLGAWASRRTAPPRDV